jgi:site-specific DNA-methyltransferase (adenine-specific)
MGFLQANYRPMKEHEDICVFSKGNATPKATNIMTYNPQGLIITNKKKIRRVGMGIGSDRKSQLGEYTSKGTNYPRSVLDFDLDSNTFHPTQKPVALFEYLVRTYTNEQEVVLDNVIGSGTTAVACINTNRNFIGIEKDEKYYDLACKRIKEHNENICK